jgi:hypothetical protein
MMIRAHTNARDGRDASFGRRRHPVYFTHFFLDTFAALLEALV